MPSAISAVLFDRIKPAFIPPGKPLLQVVVDTEEEFDWAAPFNRASTAVTSIDAQPLAQALQVMHEVLGADVAAGHLGEGAAAEPGHG